MAKRRAASAFTYMADTARNHPRRPARPAGGPGPPRSESTTSCYGRMGRRAGGCGPGGRPTSPSHWQLPGPPGTARASATITQAHLTQGPVKCHGPSHSEDRDHTNYATRTVTVTGMPVTRPPWHRQAAVLEPEAVVAVAAAAAAAAAPRPTTWSESAGDQASSQSPGVPLRH